MNASRQIALQIAVAMALVGPLVPAHVSAAPAPDRGEEGLAVFDEKTSFEDLLSRRQELERSPASLDPVARVIGVRRELSLDGSDDGRIPQDIILNGGAQAGLAEGMILTVVRKVPVIDPYRENAQSELEIEFGRVKIMHVQKDVAVARIDAIEKASSGLYVGTRSILIGDFVTRSKR